ncbi:Ig-like domain repeat protein [Methanobrevibacter sp.]
MKFNGKIILCAVFALMIICSINACSAENTFNETLTVMDESVVSLDDGNSVYVDNVEQVDADSSKLSSSEINDGIGIQTYGNPENDEVIAATGDVIYVSTTGNDDNDGHSQATAVKTIEKAVSIADGKIIISSGVYTVNSLLDIDKDLDIIGEGSVTIRSNARYDIEVYDDYYEEWDTETHYTLIKNHANLNLTNIKFTLVPTSIKDPFINNTGNLYVNSCEFSAIRVAASYGVIRNELKSKLVVNNTVFNNAASTYGAILNQAELLVNNSEFKNNDLYSESGAYATGIGSYGNVTVINSLFNNNKGTVGGAMYITYGYTIKINPVVEVINCTFKGNNAPGKYVAGAGAAIKCSGSQVTLTVKNSTFTNNVVNGNGGAIYAEGNVNIESSYFKSNSAASGNSIYVYKDTANIKDSVILDSNPIGKSDDATVVANDNWWGTNDQPSTVNGVTVDNWVKMDASYAPAHSQAGDEVTVTASFDNDNLPDGVIKVTFTSTSGNLNDEATVNDGKASVTYTIDANDEEITATSSRAVVIIPIEEPVQGVIYVSEEGDDSNDGKSQQTAVATIKHAIELASENEGKIIILEGRYVITETLNVIDDLDITGEGTVTIDGNSLGILENNANLNLTNLIFTNAKLATGSVIKDNGNATINNCTFFSCVTTGSSSAGPVNNLKGTMIINDSKFYNNSGARGIIASQSGTKLIINNSEIYDNDCTSFTNAYGILYLNSAEAIIENTEFRNNRAKNGAGVYAARATSATSGPVVIRNASFINNTAFKGQGGGVFASGTATLNIEGSKFIENKAVATDVSGSQVGGWGSGLYTSSANTKITVTQSVFIDNTANNTNYNDAGIYIGSGKLDISDSIILAKDGDTHYALNSDGATITAENNWWGSNDGANTNAEVNKIVLFNATYSPEDAQAGDEITITATFDNENLPDDVLSVTFTSTSGELNEVVPVKGAQASVNYTVDANDDAVTVSSSDAEVFLPFDADAGIIFVLPGASDSNPGTRDAPVGTIAHALEIATRGQIILLEGRHKTGDLGTISSDLNITGEGNVIIDADNNNRILYVGEDAEVVITNVIMVNGYSALESGALLGNNNKLTLINCTLSNSSAAENNGGAIYNVGKLTIINSTIANNSAREGGAIFTNDPLALNPSITIINSTIANNYASGNDNLGGGAIFAQQIAEFTIENSSFINNRVGTTASGGAIFISHSTADVKITDSQFISNHANGQNMVGGGAIYRAGASNYERQGTMTISNTLFENNTCDANGGAIYVRATTLTVSNSVLINNRDANDLAIYGYAISGSGPTLNPVITLNDNWWGTNDSPKNLVGSNTNYKPTLNRWAILTITNDSAIIAGNTVKLTVSINNYTTGSVNGTLANPINVPREVTIETTNEDIKGTLENGEFNYDYVIPDNLNYIAATVDDETQVLYVVSSPVNVAVDNITARKYDKVNVIINVTSTSDVNSGNVELYADGDLLATIPVSEGKAIGDVVISKDIGIYDLIAKFSDISGLFDNGEANATLNVTGVCELWNSTFFNFFEENGVLRSSINEDELVFHGDFSGLGINVITIPKSVSITGDNAKIYGISIKLAHDDIKMSNITFIADKIAFVENSGAVILAEASAVQLNNVTVNYTTPRGVDAFAVLATSDEFNLINSTIIFDSNNDDGSIVTQHALQIRDSNDFEVSGNVINATLPARDVAYNYYYVDRTGINQDLVLAIGIQNGGNSKLTQNEINVITKSAVGDYPTIDSIMVDGVSNLEISYNNITHLDTVNAGKAGYSNAIDLYNFDGITVKNNNVLINSTAGIEAKGTAYPVQATGPYNGLLVDSNNLTSVSNGPALGVYSQDYEGRTDIVVTNNYINVTGLATPDVYALVSGMELQDTNAKAYNNTIYTTSVGSYADENALYGISYAQTTGLTHTYDIRDNTIYTDGKYAVYLYEAQNSNVINNTLYAHELLADNAVYISGSNNVVENNKPASSIIITAIANNTKVDYNVTVEVTLSESDATGVVSIEIDGVEYSGDVDSGSATVVLPLLGAGDYTFDVVYSGDAKYESNATSVSFTVDKYTVDFTKAKGHPGRVDKNATVDVILSESDATGTVYIIVNGIEYSAELVDGAAVIYAPLLPAGVYNFDVIYSGDDKYENNSAPITFNVNKYYPTMKAIAESVRVDENAKVNVTLPSDATGTVTITVDGVDYTADVVDGTATVELPVIPEAGPQKFVVTYSGDDKYRPQTTNVEFNVLKYNANIKATARTVKLGNNVTVNVVLPDDATGKASITLNDTTYSGTVENGAATIIIPDLGVGQYALTVDYAGDDNYKPTNTTVTFNVNKQSTTMKATARTVKVGDDVTVNVALASDVTGDVIITVNGTDYSATVEDGAAVIVIPDLPAGQYALDVKYGGDDKYKNQSTTVTFNVNKYNVKMKATAKYYADGDYSIVSVTLSDDATGSISVEVNGNNYTVNVVEGSALVAISKLPAGEYPLDVVYSGDAKYKDYTVATTLNVVK